MMSSEYEYLCMRADLLGLPHPEKSEVLAQQEDRDESEYPLKEVAEQQELERDELNKVSSGLDELNTILTSTQKKLNRFKVVCGSFTNLLKIRVSSGGKDDGTPSETSSRGSVASDIGNIDEKETNGTAETATPQHSATAGGARKEPLNVESAINSQLSKLDRMILKAETAEISMNSQNKEMKSYLKK